jgi:hypothetical protein
MPILLERLGLGSHNLRHYSKLLLWQFWVTWQERHRLEETQASKCETQRQ